MVGGKIESDESAWQAALRELLEETGLRPVRLWTIPSANMFYEWEDDRVNIVPAFAAEVSQDPEMDAEHDEFQWVTAEDAAGVLHWPEQKRLIRLAAETFIHHIPPELFVRIEEGYSW